MLYDGRVRIGRLEKTHFNNIQAVAGCPASTSCTLLQAPGMLDTECTTYLSRIRSLRRMACVRRDNDGQAISQPLPPEHRRSRHEALCVPMWPSLAAEGQSSVAMLQAEPLSTQFFDPATGVSIAATFTLPLSPQVGTCLPAYASVYCIPWERIVNGSPSRGSSPRSLQ